MQGYKLELYCIKISREELKEIYCRMLDAFRNKNEFEDIIYDGDFQVKFILSAAEREKTVVSKEDNSIILKITINEVGTILSRIDHALLTSKVGESMQVMEYLIYDNAFIRFIAQQ